MATSQELEGQHLSFGKIWRVKNGVTDPEWNGLRQNHEDQTGKIITAVTNGPFSVFSAVRPRVGIETNAGGAAIAVRDHPVVGGAGGAG
jgi:hypothetical protein